jgi:hypothetical protein
MKSGLFTHETKSREDRVSQLLVQLLQRIRLLVNKKIKNKIPRDLATPRATLAAHSPPGMCVSECVCACVRVHVRHVRVQTYTHLAYVVYTHTHTHTHTHTNTLLDTLLDTLQTHTHTQTHC